MKKFWKIVGISLGALIGLVLVVVSVVVWMVFTPSRLTPIVRQVADKIITCEYEIGEVELTFFSTFPEFGLRADTLCLINACEGAKADTILFAPQVVATVDVMSLWKDRHLNVRQLTLSNVEGYVYLSDSISNIEVLALAEDTVAADTTGFVLPFDRITVGALQLTAKKLVLDDRRDSIDAALYNTSIQAHMNGWEDMMLSLSSSDVCAKVGEEVYANHLSVGARLPLSIDTELRSVDLQQAWLQVNDYRLKVDGIVSVADSMSMQLHVQMEDWQIAPLLALLPATVTASLQEIEVDGLLSLNADISGVYSQEQMPLVDATVVLSKGKGRYATIPYTLRDVNVEADVHVDLNEVNNSNVVLHRLAAKTKSSSVELRGRVDQVLTDMQMDVQLGVNVYVPDMAYFLPDNMQMNGRVKGRLDVKSSMDELLALQLDDSKVKADLQWQDFAYEMGDMHANSALVRLRAELPNTTPSAEEMNWADVRVSLSGLEFAQKEQITATMGASEWHVEVSDVLADTMFYAQVDMQSTEALAVDMDTISAYVTTPQLKTTVAYNTKDTSAIPTIAVQLAYSSVEANYGTIFAAMKASTLEANLSPSKRNKAIPRLEAAIHTDALEAKMDTALQVQTANVTMRAVARYNEKADNVLLRWNPRLEVVLENGVVQLPMIKPTVVIPQIDFAYSNREFHIEQSQLQLGNSDFALSGDVRNIGAWLRKKGDLQGELNFVSDYTDVNELMALFSAESGSEEESVENTVSLAELPDGDSAETTDAEREPFLVPLHVDLVLNTHINEATVFAENLRNLKGKLYVKDGILVLEEMGFVCNAAKLQLTAMYRTPRRNHIYVGMDYHMVDIHIEELVRMLPQLDTIVPMLKSFKGSAEFHLAAETYTNSKYEIKPSTLRGACSLVGKDLVVMDSETFSMISKKLLFNKKTENRVDSLAAEITVYKKEIDVYPLCVSMDNYMIALGGRHNLDMTFNYDVNVLSPIYLGVNVSGSIDDLDIKLTKCKYAKDFRPVFQNKVSQETSQLRMIIRESMRKNVKIE